MGQLSFWSADARPRGVEDLAGVLCARGQLSVFGRGTTARLGIVLGVPPSGPAEEPEEGADPDEGGDAGEDDGARPPEDPPSPDPPGPDPLVEWRAHALRCAFLGRGVDADVDRTPDGRPVVRSAFRADLVALARAWTRGAVKAVPPGFELDGSRLRLWALAAGRREGRSYVLGLDPHAPGTHEPLLAACRRAGLGATAGGDRAEPLLRVTGVRRRRRLAELVGERPGPRSGPGDEVWPV